MGFLFTFLIAANVFAAKTTFTKEEVIFPKGKAEIEKFLELLKDPENKKVVHLLDSQPVAYKEIPKEGSAVFYFGMNSYMLYWDDFNNDGNKEYLVIYIQSGSGSYSGVQGVFALDGKKLTSMNFDKIVVDNLFPGKDMSRFHMVLAAPFAVKIGGKTYLRFLDREPKTEFFTYKWEGSKFTKAQL